ncbi:MucR family transcriptional regulator [Falsochrobactrum ovis]|uniref:MucR family transcriptional regulator n=1 Tax=Falsochrobactrum ovis TaxID=1293442 RepID=UPI00247ABA41|nr:MucR family transcriptional regulator [Falsochrobactrum ovis]
MKNKPGIIGSRRALCWTAADIVTSYVGHNNVPPKDLPDLIRQVHRSLGALANPHIDRTIRAYLPSRRTNR